ncbi:Protein cwh43 [Psilocybe cubensis]|uniref:Protein cwh43 n=1 Tax=Psilocybe cubensis TaxID=181762 RepID=A0ACB8H2U3_PSICU|nr:Protein cwh43 [Psilocybe cubensis]KAH9481549.1 Protein cwh43 [Psilocybe cubensis]
MAVARIHAAPIARLHTSLATTAFLSALILGCALHYRKIVKNSVAQYPDEWFPSVSATIGDWYPERNIFQILIALTSGPRFALVFLQYFLHHSSTSSLPTVVFLSGLVRTLSCGGWVYITSSDDHDVHDFMMILYMVCNIPWMLLGIACTPPARTSVRRKRMLIAGAFFATIGPLVYFFIQHKVHRIPGAYTRYAFFEWGLIFFDVLYDSVAEQEFREADLHASCLLTLAGSHIDKPLANAVESALAPAHTTHATSQNASRIPASWRNVLTFLSDVYLSYVFWTLFTSLIPTLFYFSVWKLGIAGHELALLSVLSPLLLSLQTNLVPSVLAYARSRKGQGTLQLISLIGVVAYLVPSPGGRLGLVAVANIVAVMRQVVAWSGIVDGETDVPYQAIVTGLGILTSSLLKQANRANNPLWPFINHKAGGYNKTGLVLALLAIYEYSARPVFSTPKTTKKSTAQVKPEPFQSAWRGALPLGSLLFCIHNLLSEPSTLIAWSWTGYENRLPRGPVPHIHGSLTVLAMALGLLLACISSKNNKLGSVLTSPAWFLFGTGSSYVMYAYRNWMGYVGGLGVAAFLMSLLPGVFHTAAYSAGDVGGSGRNISKTYSMALAVYCVLNLASIFTVAYAFVPGGIYLRERTDLVTTIQIACFLPAFRWSTSKSSGHAISTSSQTRYATKDKYKPHILITLFILSSLSLLTTLHRVPRTIPVPYKSGTRIFNTGIWTVHFGIDNEGHDSQRGILNLIKDMELDIVGLLETDLHRTAFGHRDLTRLIVEESNYNVDIGPGPNAHTWGAVLLSKFPIISTKHHLLPSPHGELAPAIEAVLDVYGTEVLVVVAHNGQEEDPLDRELQSTELAKIMAASTRPVVFLGYVVTKPHTPRPNPYGIMVNEGNVHDIDEDDLDRWGLYRTSYARVSRGIITDTETQIGQFVLPRQGHNVTDDSKEARYLRSRKEELAVEHWFPMPYYGDEKQGGVNGHYYHVFNTIPESAEL